VSKISLALAIALCTPSWCQQPATDWHVAVRKYAEAKDWPAAMAVVEAEQRRSPRDVDIQAWRARVLLWWGRLDEAEHEWQVVISQAPNDPDNWMALASVYQRRVQPSKALEALDAAVKLDPHRPDIHIARARALLALQQAHEAKQEFREALELDANNPEAKAGLRSFSLGPRNQLAMSTNTDWFNFANANRQGEISLASRWTPRFQTAFMGGFYQRGSLSAQKFGAAVTARSPRFGSLTIGGAAAQDNGIIPKHEFLFELDHGWKFSSAHPLRGIEVVYGQHWYWYSAAQIFAINETTILYLPKEWTWSLGLTGARSQFSGLSSEWSPSGTVKLGFPLVASERRPLLGYVFYSVGSENFSQVDQIGSFASRTYGGGLRFRLTSLQDVTSFGSYQMRSQDRTQTTFGATYGLRF
jgi:tetratricopeptide (TPR) repeat protein